MSVPRWGRRARAPKGASVHPAKGVALVGRLRRNPFIPGNFRPNGPTVRLQSRAYCRPISMPLSSQKGNRGTLGPLGRIGQDTVENKMFVVAAVPGLRPSLIELLGLRPEEFPHYDCVAQNRPQILPSKGTNSTDCAQVSPTLLRAPLEITQPYLASPPLLTIRTLCDTPSPSDYNGDCRAARRQSPPLAHPHAKEHHRP